MYLDGGSLGDCFFFSAAGIPPAIWSALQDTIQAKQTVLMQTQEYVAAEKAAQEPRSFMLIRHLVMYLYPPTPLHNTLSISASGSPRGVPRRLGRPLGATADEDLGRDSRQMMMGHDAATRPRHRRPAREPTEWPAW